MGRFYDGDIQGKFSFGAQSSDDGEYYHAEPLEPTVIDYRIANEDIPRALAKLTKLISKYNKETKSGIHFGTTTDQFWKSVDKDWFQDQKNALLAGRIHMGLEIVHYHQENPESDIYFEAEL